MSILENFTFEDFIIQAPAWHCVAEQFGAKSTGKDLVSLNEKQTVGDVINILASHNFMSAPVLTEAGTMKGIVSVWDIVTGLRSRIDASGLSSLAKVAPAFFKEPIAALVREETPFPRTLPMNKLFEIFGSGTQHVFLDEGDTGLVSDTPPKICAVATQSAAVRFACPFLTLCALGAKTMAELGFAKGSVVSVKASTAVIDALALITDSQLTALAVVDDKGKLLGNLSVRDFLGLRTSTYEALTEPIITFLQKHSPASLEPISCRPDTSFYTVVHRLVKRRLYRMWVIDAEDRPISVMSLTNVCDLINGLLIKRQQQAA